MTQAPAFIRVSGPIAGRLLRAGVPMGPNVVLTVRGRRSGLPRSAAVAIVAAGGRRWVVGTFGEVHWVRNLRAAGEATICVGGREVAVNAVELHPTAAADFFRDVVPAYLATLPVQWRLLVRILLRLAAREITADPRAAALRRPVFELTPMSP